MRTIKNVRLTFAAILPMIGTVALYAQDSAPPSATSSSTDEVVQLNPFNVSSRELSRYTAADASAGGRMTVNLMDSLQSISVVTNDLITDSGAIQMTDAAKFVSGVSVSTIPNDDDRIEIRGFQSEGQTINGFTSAGQGEMPIFLVDRLEVIKGPDAILAPSAVPGGTVNMVTKTPQFQSSFGSISYQAGLYDANMVNVDVNQVLNSEFAFRLVATYRDSRNFADSPLRSTGIMPVVSYRNAHGLEMTLTWMFFNFKEQDYFGYPIDPSSGTLTTGVALKGVPRNLNYDGDTYRSDKRPAVLYFTATTPITDSLSTRIAAHYEKDQFGDNTQATAGGATGGGVDPRTGDFVPGYVFGGASTNYAATPAPPFPATSVRTGIGTLRPESVFADFQNDNVYIFKNDFFTSTSTAGFAYNYTINNSVGILDNSVPITYTAPTPTVSVYTVPVSKTHSVNTRTQLYVNETVNLFQGRLSLSGGYSDLNYLLTTRDDFANQNYEATIDKGLVNYGVIVKPIPQVALYFGHTANSAANSVQSISTGSAPTTNGTQNEGGLRFQLLDKRVYATVAYYHIDQSNFGVTNPRNNEFPIPVPQLPALIETRVAKGWEYELHAAITSELSFVGNATVYTNRDPNNIPFRGAAEKSWVAALRYEFANQSVLKGLSVGLNADWLAKRPGDQGSGLTALNVPIQASFYLPQRTLVNMLLAYRFNSHWKAQVNIDNLLDKKYLEAALNRFNVWQGSPTNVRLTVTYSW